LSDLPGELKDGQPFSACAELPLLGLAPERVCLPSPVTRERGGLLPRLFTLTRKTGKPVPRAVYSLWYCLSKTPYEVPSRPLTGIISEGARTFLDAPDRF